MLHVDALEVIYSSTTSALRPDNSMNSQTTLLMCYFYIAKFYSFKKKYYPAEAMQWPWRSSLGIKEHDCILQASILCWPHGHVSERPDFWTTLSIHPFKKMKLHSFRTPLTKRQSLENTVPTLAPHSAGQCSISTLSLRHARMLLIRCFRGTATTYFAWQGNAQLLSSKPWAKNIKAFQKRDSQCPFSIL